MPDARMENGGIPRSDDAGPRQPGNGSSIAGLCLIGAGALLLSMGVTSVAARSAATAAARPPPSRVEIPCPSMAPGTAHASAPPAVTDGGIAAAPPARGIPAGSNTAPAAASSTAAAVVPNADIAADAPLLVIHFVRKEVIPQKDDIAKLAALGAKLARRETVKVVLEGFGDEAGKDEATKGLGRRRGTVLKRTLADVGVALERVTIVPFDVADAEEGAGTVRLRTLPPVPAADLK